MKIVSSLLALFLVIDSLAFADQKASTAGSAHVQGQETPQAAKIKAEVQKRCVGKESSVRAKPANGNEAKGYISKIEETSFTVTDKKTGQTITIPYADVQKIRGPGLSKGGKIALVVVGVAVVVLVTIGVAVSHAD